MCSSEEPARGVSCSRTAGSGDQSFSEGSVNGGNPATNGQKVQLYFQMKLLSFMECILSSQLEGVFLEARSVSQLNETSVDPKTIGQL